MAADERKFLAEEYDILQKLYHDLGNRALTAKPWSVTFSAAGLGLAYTQHSTIILVIAIASAAIFWVIEATLKSHQTALVRRIVEIEKYFRGEISSLKPFQIRASRDQVMDEKHRVRRVMDCARYPHVALPHAAILFFGAILLIFYRPN